MRGLWRRNCLFERIGWSAAAMPRLFLPESWTSKRDRLERAGVPAEYRTARTKPEMALAEIDRAIAAGVRFGCVLYRVPEIVTLGRLPGEGESDSRRRTKEVRHVGSDTL